MKLVIKLPGGGWIKYEKKPMSDEARSDLMGGLMFLCFIGAMLIFFWMFR